MIILLLLEKKYGKGINNKYPWSGFNFNGGDDCYRRLKYIFHLISLCLKYEGYVYGQFNKDVLIPCLINKKCPTKVEFNSVEIWFSKKQNYKKFLNHVENLKYISLSKTPYISSSNTFKDVIQNYVFSVPDLGGISHVDFVVSKYLPANFLIFNPKGNDYGMADISWFD